jgi:hypothetical protein
MRKSENEKEKEKRRFSQEQYEMLICCIQKGREGIEEWNQWREDNPDEDIFLEGANLENFSLNGINFANAYLRGANLDSAYLEDAMLHMTHLENANLRGACLKRAELFGTYLNEATLLYCCLEDTEIMNANFKRAVLFWAHLEGASLKKVNFEGAILEGAIVDNSTLIWNCEVDRDTDFRSVALNNANIDPATKQLLEYNIRRMNWEDWYKESSWLKWFVKPFWWMSDYGLSTGRIVITFFVLAIAFAGIYYVWGMIAPPGIVDYLFVDGNGVEVVWWLVPIRAIHFSVVIMTVGFTNMHANAHSFWAHILVSLQMILGFVLLGALVTRFAVLFTAGGPAGRFAKKDTKVKHDAR